MTTVLEASDLPNLLEPFDPDGSTLTDRLYTTADLRRIGMSKRDLRATVAAGVLLRVRNGIYMLSGSHSDAVAASRQGARLSCVSVLEPLGVFVRHTDKIHLHFQRHASKYTPDKRTAVWHWSPLVRTPHPRATRVELLDALAQSTACQSPRDAIATLDSALNIGLISSDDLDEIFAAVPARRRVLRRFVDGRAESGTESIVRLMAVALGFDVQVQVSIQGVGRVDLLLDGWLVVECDSEKWHTGWKSQKRDRRRDLMLAARGMCSLRPVAEDIVWHPELIVDALRGMREAHQGR